MDEITPDIIPEGPAETPSPGAASGLWRTTTAIVACKLAGNGAAAGVVVVTARELGASGRGILVLLLTLASFLLLICSVGLNLSGRIHLVGEDARVDSEAFLGLSATLTVVQAVLCSLLGTVLLPVVHVHLSVAQNLVFGLLGGSLLAPFLLNAAINAYGNTTLAAAVDGSGNVIQLLFAFVLVARHVHSVTAYVGALVVGNVVQTVLALGALRSIGVAVGLSYQPAQWRVLVRTGLPGIAMDVSSVLTFRLDRYLLGIFLTPAAVGVYSVAATAPELLRLPALALSQPIFHRLASGSARASDFARTRILALGMTAVLAGVTFAAAPLAVRIVFGPEFLAAVTPLRILLLAEFGITNFYIDGSLLAAGFKRIPDASRAACAGLVVVVIADLTLIPPFGLAGAAWGSVAAYSMVGLAAHFLVRRRQRRAVTARA